MPDGDIEKERRKRQAAIRKRKDGKAEQGSPKRVTEDYQNNVKKGTASNAAFGDQRPLRSIEATPADRKALQGFRTATDDPRQTESKRKNWEKDRQWAAKQRSKHPELPAAMNDEEMVALRDYSGVHYQQINGALRTGQDQKGVKRGATFSKDEARAYTNCACSGLNKLPPHKGTVFRGTTIPAEVVADLESGRPIQDKAFQSSSTSAKVAMGGMAGRATKHVLEIRNPKSGRNIEALSYQGAADYKKEPGEQEVLFPPGTKLRLVEEVKTPDGKAKNPRHFVVEEVD